MPSFHDSTDAPQHDESAMSSESIPLPFPDEQERPVYTEWRIHGKRGEPSFGDEPHKNGTGLPEGVGQGLPRLIS